MSRLKLLVVAVLIAGAGGFYLSSGAQRSVDKVRAQGSGQLQAAVTALKPSLEQFQTAQLAAVKSLAADTEIGQAFDDANKPTSAALEVAVAALSKLLPDGLKPDLLVISSGGAAARYRVGASNRFDPTDAAFKPLGPLGAARGLVATLDGELFEVAVASLATTGDPPPPAVGQVALGWVLDEAWARKLAAQAGPGLGVTLVAGKKVIASTLPPVERKALPTAVRPGTPVDFGALTGDRFQLLPGVPVPLPLGAAGVTSSRAVALSLGGDAAAVLSLRVADGYADLAADQRELVLGLLGLIAFCLFLALVGANPTKGLAEVAAIADKIAQGDVSLRAPTEKLAPGVRRFAVALNAIAANAGTRSPSVPPPPPKASFEPKVEELLAQAAAPVPDGNPDAVLKETVPGVPSPLAGLAIGRAEPEPPKAAALVSPPPRREDDFGGIFDAPGSAAAAPPRPATAPPSPAPPRPFPPAPPAPLAAGFGRVPSPLESDDADAFNPDATVVAQVPDALLKATRGVGAAGKSGFQGAVPLPPPSASPEETHFQAVFREFVATREKCGEAADGLTYDKFVAKLKKNKDQLVAKYSCKGVRFQVYVKEGKAALKATPVRD